MATLWRQLLCGCCRQPKYSEDEEPNEHSRLIHPTAGNGAIPTTSNYTVDHQKLRDKLGTIVRAKEGRMVNVNAPVPFNLNNEDVNGRRLNPSSSRSARSHSAHATVGGPPGYGPEMLPEVPSRMAFYSPARDREPSPVPDISQSTSSLHPGDASYLPDAEEENGSRRPILNMRLVRSVGRFRTSGNFVSRSRQGRSPARGRSGFAEAVAVPEGSAEDMNGSAHVNRFHGENPDRATGDDGEVLSASTSQGDFKIESVGKITCSWGD